MPVTPEATEPLVTILERTTVALDSGVGRPRSCRDQRETVSMLDGEHRPINIGIPDHLVYAVTIQLLARDKGCGQAFTVDRRN